MEPDAGSPRPPEQTTVVGYPGSTPAAAAPSGYASPGMASLRSQVSSVRLLVIACLALLLVLAVGVGVGLASSRAQLQDLSDQVAALSAQAAANAQPATDSGQTQGSGQAAPQESVQQLGAAVELPAGSDIPAGADTAGAILIGNPDAANVVEVYVDYQCPFCQRWEAEIGSVLAERALQPGSDLLLKQYNLAFLGETSPSLSPAGASARAASAAACVLDADGVETFVAFNQGVFASADPTEPPTQFSAEALSELARQAGASDDAITCIESEAQVPFVAATTQAGFGRGVGGTPTVLVNGQTLGNPFTDPAITSLVAGS
jgi:protein-disulfide isomerase